MDIDELRRIYFEYLEKEGYTPRIHEQGETDLVPEDAIGFKYRGKNFLLETDPDDLDYLCVYQHAIFEVKNAIDPQEFYKTVSEINNFSHYIKIFIADEPSDGNEFVYISVTTMISDKNHFGKYLGRMLEEITDAIDLLLDTIGEWQVCGEGDETEIF
jgi:hypothetical protein